MGLVAGWINLAQKSVVMNMLRPPFGENATDCETSMLDLPRSSAENTTILIHYYRGEIARMSSWRARLDQTSNWAITVTAAMLSVSLSTPTAHHGVLLFAMLLIALLLLIEARRYRFFDVYRTRVRLLERHYFARLFSGSSQAEQQEWHLALADSLRKPTFRITQLQAAARRLRRNYGWMFLILLFAWLLKISSAMLQPAGAEVDAQAPYVDIIASAQLGPLPGAVVLAAVGCLHLLLLWIGWQDPRYDEAMEGSVHV